MVSYGEMRLDTAAVAELKEGLSRPLPEVPAKYLYDDRGSDLFEQITRLPEYYQTRTEESILEARAAEIVRRTRPRELVELGSGAGRKVRMLLDEMARRGLLRRLLLLEINERFLEESLARLEELYPDLEVRGIPGDFNHDLHRLGPGGHRLVLLLAGTIGNLLPAQAATFTGLVAKQLAPGDGFLVGFDLAKDPARLEAAYNDAQGVTAQFNLNILRVLNDRFQADFDVDGFEHVAFYDAQNAWIEMRVRAKRPMEVQVAAAGVHLSLGRGDEIRTEVSCKFTRERASAMAAVGGLVLDGWWTDPDDLFALGLLEKVG